MLRRFLLVCCACLTAAAGAQTGTGLELPLPQYPPGSIRSVAQADRALQDAKFAQLAQEKAFVARRQVCYAKLIAETCLIDATEDNVRAERRIRAIQVEAREFKRREADRDARAIRARKQQQEADDAPRKQAERERAGKDQQDHVQRNARAEREFEAGADERARRAAAEQRRIDERQAARARKAADERAARAEREQRARDHQEKVDTVLKRAREKEQRALEKAPPAPVARQVNPEVPTQAVPAAARP